MTERQTSSNIIKLHSFDTVYSADSVEWCPHEPHQNKFVCANYKLNEASQTESGKPERVGKIRLFSLNPDKLFLHEEKNTAAILDQKWSYSMINSHSVLGTVDASNELQIFKLVPDTSELEKLATFRNDEVEVMMLSLDWSNGKYDDNDPLIVVSDTQGKIHLFKFKNVSLEKELSLNGHDFEAWICAFYYWNTSVIFSGGDDSKLLKFDIRVGNEPVAKSRAHTAGVTCIHSNKEKEFLLATGSYDQNLLLWDIRNMKNPLHSVEMPGPMWRVKWDPQTHTYILAACMLGGFHIVDTKFTEPKIIASYHEHSDLAYGSDWSYLTDTQVKTFGNANRIFAACSFYDHKMSVACIDLNAIKP